MSDINCITRKLAMGKASVPLPIPKSSFISKNNTTIIGIYNIHYDLRRQYLKHIIEIVF